MQHPVIITSQFMALTSTTNGEAEKSQGGTSPETDRETWGPPCKQSTNVKAKLKEREHGDDDTKVKSSRSL